MENHDFKNAKPLEEVVKEIFLPLEDKVICAECGKRHFQDEDTFFTFYGNVTVGFNGGIIGNNLNPDGTIGRLFFLCRKYNCLSILVKLTDDPPVITRNK